MVVAAAAAAAQPDLSSVHRARRAAMRPAAYARSFAARFAGDALAPGATEYPFTRSAGTLEDELAFNVDAAPFRELWLELVWTLAVLVDRTAELGNRPDVAELLGTRSAVLYAAAMRRMPLVDRAAAALPSRLAGVARAGDRAAVWLAWAQAAWCWFLRDAWAISSSASVARLASTVGAPFSLEQIIHATLGAAVGGPMLVRLASNALSVPSSAELDAAVARIAANGGVLDPNDPERPPGIGAVQYLRYVFNERAPWTDAAAVARARLDEREVVDANDVAGVVDCAVRAFAVARGRPATPPERVMWRAYVAASVLPGGDFVPLPSALGEALGAEPAAARDHVYVVVEQDADGRTGREAHSTLPWRDAVTGAAFEGQRPNGAAVYTVRRPAAAAAAARSYFARRAFALDFGAPALMPPPPSGTQSPRSVD